MKKICRVLMMLMMVLGLSVSGHATLIDMGDGTIYDTDTELSWLKNANMNGRRWWSDAITWANNLVFAGFDDWRLPTTLQPDPSCDRQAGVYSYGYNCTGSEMGDLYTKLRNLPHDPYIFEDGVNRTNVGGFTNLLLLQYWSATEWTLDTTYAYYFFLAGDGIQDREWKRYDFAAIAVRSGHRATSVPEPTSLFLLGFGLAGIAILKKRFRWRVG